MTICHVSYSKGNSPGSFHFRRPSPGRNLSSAFTLLELLVTIAIIVLLGALLFPAYKGILAKSQLATCLSNLRQTGVAIGLYTSEHDNRLPGPLPANNFTPGYRDNGGVISPDGEPLYVYLWPYLSLPHTTTTKLARIGVCPSAWSSGQGQDWLLKSKFFTSGIHAIQEYKVYYPRWSELPSSDGYSRACPFGLAPLAKPWTVTVISSPSQFALLCELPGSIKNHTSFQKIEGNEMKVGHKNESTILFLDGHVTSQPSIPTP